MSNTGKRDITSISDLSKQLEKGTEPEPQAQITEADFAPLGEPVAPASPAPPVTEPSPSVIPEFSSTIHPAQEEPLPQISEPADPLAQVQQYSEQAGVQAEVPASYPFSLLIDGPLAPDEREKLLDIVSRENLGVREVDLEPQFLGQKILIPRISEYAGVMVVQALRGTHAKMTLGPSDEVFATAATREFTNHATEPSSDTSRRQVQSAPTEHPAESLPVTAGGEIPGLEPYRLSGVITASAALQSNLVEASHSDEYHTILEALQRELRYKAFHRGAIGILNYQVQLVSLNLPSHYKLMVSGTAVKPTKKDELQDL